MKVLTKELNYVLLDLHDLQCAVDSIAKRTMPVVFFNGIPEGIAGSDIKTVRTQLNVSDKENELNFMILPASFTFTDHYEDASEDEPHSPEEDFLSEYANRLRIISALPEEILKGVKDKRVLAMGYAEPKVKKAIIKYALSKKKAALNVYEKSLNDSIYATEGLTIEDQFGKQHQYIFSLQDLFEETTITTVSSQGNDLYFELDNDEAFVLTNVETLEEEVKPNNTHIRFFELYKTEQSYELHFLLVKKDSNLMENFYYVTYRFTDMRFCNS